MLYLLLYRLHKVHPGFNVLRYETFRSVVAGLAALALSLALGPLLIERFRSARIGQTIREEPAVVLIWTSIVPTSVTVPTRIPSRTTSPTRNRALRRPRLPPLGGTPGALESVTAIAARNQVAGLSIHCEHASEGCLCRRANILCI